MKCVPKLRGHTAKAFIPFQGFHSVPTFIFNEEHIIPGGQSKDSFKRFITQLNETA